MPGKPILSCLLCKRRYSRQDVEEGRYWPQTFVCSFCYARMQQAPIQVSCFGKTAEVNHRTGHRELGYDPEALECREVCPDREVCRRVFQL